MTSPDERGVLHSDRSGVVADGTRDVAGGLLIAGLGLLAGTIGSRYEFGTLDRIGPGFFPAVLAVMLIGLGSALVLVGARSGLALTFQSLPASNGSGER